eukprot:gene7486-8316_t
MDDGTRVDGPQAEADVDGGVYPTDANKNTDDYHVDVVMPHSTSHGGNDEKKQEANVVTLRLQPKDSSSKEFENVNIGGGVMEKQKVEEAEQGFSGKRWQPYEDAGLEMPVTFFVPPVYYKFRWMWVQAFQKNVFLDICIGEIIMFFVCLIASAVPAGATCCDEESTGGAAIIPLLLTFVFASRNSVFTFLFGVPFERVLKWHKWLALLSVASGVYHGVIARNGDSSEVTSGIILTSLMGALVVFSFFPIRRVIFEVFLKFHWLLFIGVIVLALIHEAGAVMIGAGIWAVDVLFRCVILWRNRSNSTTAMAVKLPADIIRLTFKKKNFKYKSGQYIFLCLPKVSLFEWHPFSISSSPHHDEVHLHIRVLGDWTKRLYNVASSQEMTIFIDGPYGQPSVDVDGDKYKTFLFVSGGIGITPMQSICNDLISQYKRGRPLHRIFFIWSVRDAFMVSSILDYDRQYFGTNIPHTLPYSFSPDLVTENLQESVLDAQFYLTRAREPQDYESANIHPNLQTCLKFGRPKLDQIFAQVNAEALANKENRVAVLSCGPSRLVSDVMKFSNSYSRNGVSFDFHSELFEF